MSVRELRRDRPSGWFSKSRGLSASVSFLSSSPPPRSFTCATFHAVFDSRSVLLNRTETLATQATFKLALRAPARPHWAFEHFLFLYHQPKFTALFFSAHSTSTAHICWRWAVLPFADQTFRFRFKTYIVFSRQNLFFTCIALRWLNSCLFLGNSRSFFNFNQPHKWSGILKCFSLQKGVFSSRINEWARSWISLYFSPSAICVQEGSKQIDWFPYADWRILITWP